MTGRCKGVMQCIGEYLKKHILVVIRYFSLGCLLFIAVWLMSDYEFSDGVLYGFPMFCFPYKGVIADKKVVALLFPLIMNIALWIPYKKSYSLIFGIWTVEKWKSLLIAIASGIILVGSVMFMPVGSGEFFWNFFFAIGYFILLHYGLKEISGEEFIKRNQIEEKSQTIESKTRAAAVVYVVLVIAYIAEFSLQCYYTPLPSESTVNYSVGGGIVTDISSDEKTLISYVDDRDRNDDSKTPKGKFEVRDMETGNVMHVLDQSNVVYGQYGADDSQLIVQKVNYDKKEGWFELYDIKTGEMIKDFPHVGELASTVNEIQYSTDKKYFAARERFITIWDYDEEKLLKKYNNFNYVEEFIWLDHNKYFVIQENIERFPILPENQERWTKPVKWKAELGEITKDKDIKIIEKNKIAKIVGDKMAGLYYEDVYMESLKNEKVVAVVVRGIPSNGWFRRRSYLLFWDVEKEEVIFSLDSNYDMNDIRVFPEENCFVVIEGIKSDWAGRGRRKVTVWNLQTKKKEKTIIIRNKKGGRRRYQKITQCGIKIIIFGKEVSIWKNDLKSR